MHPMDTNLVHEQVKPPAKQGGRECVLAPDLEELLCRRYYVDGEKALALQSYFRPLCANKELSESGVRAIAKRVWSRLMPKLSPEDLEKAAQRGRLA